MAIKNWKGIDKPREKIMAQGKAALSNAELLTILISSGAVDEGAVILSRRVLASVGDSLAILGKQTLAQFAAFKGTGTTRATTILAAIEIGRRRATEAPEPQPRIEAPHNIFTLMQPFIGDLPHEEFWVLYLSSANHAIHKCRPSSEDITHTAVDIRLLFKSTLKQGAVAAILVRNHSSDSIEPSHDSIQLTQRVKTATETSGIKLLGYVIITEKVYESLVENGVMF